MKAYILTTCFLLPVMVMAQNNYYVASTGDDAQEGTFATPWQTIQFGLNQLSAGDTLNIRAGVYAGKIDVDVSGTTMAKITIRNYQNEIVIINGDRLFDSEYLMKIEETENITVQGIHFQDYQKLDAIGILVLNSSHISILNNEFSNIDYAVNAVGKTPNESQNSQPIIVYGRDSVQSVTDILIKGNEVFHCETGFSECISLNGNVDGFQVLDNLVHDNTNIGIDAIGFEGECPKSLYDQARNGLIHGNVVHHNSSRYAAAGGIYVDGGKSIIVENNLVYNNDYGIEIGCENNGRITGSPAASEIVVRNNFMYRNKLAGLVLGGFNYPTTGKVEKVVVRNNTCFDNDTNDDYNGELTLSYIEESTIENNIFYESNRDHVLIITTRAIPTVSFDYNLYYSKADRESFVIEINGQEFNSLDSFQSVGQDQHSQFGDPKFLDTTEPILNIMPNSPAVDAGSPATNFDVGERDIDGEVRIFNGRIDIGADEFQLVSAVKKEKSLPVLVTPNPTNGVMEVAGVAGFSYEVFASDGRLVGKGKTDGSSVNLSGLKAGIYLIELISKGNKRYYAWVGKN